MGCMQVTPAIRGLVPLKHATDTGNIANLPKRFAPGKMVKFRYGSSLTASFHCGVLFLRSCTACCLFALLFLGAHTTTHLEIFLSFSIVLWGNRSQNNWTFKLWNDTSMISAANETLQRQCCQNCANVLLLQSPWVLETSILQQSVPKVLLKCRRHAIAKV